MRKIKFRAWDKENKKMIYNVIPMHGGLSSGIITVSYEGLIKGSFEERLSEPMQYTGLKDKNGREVFEGDILMPFDTKYTCLVKWDDREGWYDAESSNLPGLSTYKVAPKYWNLCEVIGNIYENPELLNK